MKKTATLALLLTLLVLCASLSALSAQGPSAADWLNRDAVIEAAREITRERYPNADDVLVDDLIRARYEPDGTSMTTDDTYVKVLSEKGRRENQTLSFHFTIPYSRVEVRLVEVIKSDGTIIPVDVTSQSRVMTDRSQMSENIFNPNRKILRVGVPGVQVGDLVHYQFIRRTVKARVPNTWGDYEVLEYTSPIKHYVYEVVAPRALPLQTIALRGEIEGTVRRTRAEKGDRLHYRWEVTDVPRMYEEPDMPPLHTVTQRLLVSTIKDWRDISRWYWEISKPHLDATDEMKRTIADLTRGLTDPRARIEAVFRFVSQKIRYMGITTEKEAPGYEPHDVRITFENRYGVCRDKAALLVAMLREAGVKAFPVLIHNGPRKDPDVPQPYFNHAIVAAEGPDGAYQLMDPTDENTRDLFPSYLANQSYLVARPEGETLLISPLIPAEQNLVRVQTTGKLNENGDLAAETVLRFEGVNDGAYRGYFARLKPSERRRFFEGLAKRAVSGARLVDIEIRPADLRDVTQPLVVTMKLEAPGVLITDGETAMLPAFSFGTRVGLVNFLLDKTGLKERRYPLVTGFACGVRETLSLNVAQALGPTQSMPQFESVADPALSFNQTLERHGDALKGRRAFLLKAVEFSPEQYVKLKDALKTMEHDSRKMPLFSVKAATAPPDIEILESNIKYHLTDAHNWTETRTAKLKILTYAGKKRNSELKFNYNPVWEEIKLEYAVVTSPKGDKKSVSEEEKNVLDAAWVGAAPRYPPAKTLVVSLPGIEPGSVIEYRVKRIKKNRPFFAARQSFRGFDPIKLKKVLLDRPQRVRVLKARFGSSDAARAEETTKDLRAVSAWTALDAEPVKRERYLPPWWSFNPTVCLSAGNWRVYAREVRNVLQQAAAGQPEARRKAKELITGLATRQERARAIRDFVARNVRLVGPALHEVPLSAITPADITLREGYGNTADRAVLLYAMLKAARMRPQFVLASPTPLIRGLKPPLLTCPGPGDFPTVLVRVRIGKDVIYLNDTDQYTALGATPHDNTYGLALRYGRIETIRAPVGRRDRSAVRYDVTILENGDARITKATEYFGNAFGDFHRRFAELPPEERRRYHQEAVAAVAQSAEADGDLVTDFGRYPGIERLDVIVKRFAVIKGDTLYFRLPETLDDLFGLRADRRDNPLYWPHNRRMRIHTQVKMPADYDALVLRPPGLTWTAPQHAGSVRVSNGASVRADGSSGATRRGFVLEVKHYVELEPAVMDAAAYPELMQLQHGLSHPGARTVLVRKKAETDAGDK